MQPPPITRSVDFRWSFVATITAEVAAPVHITPPYVGIIDHAAEEELLLLLLD